MTPASSLDRIWTVPNLLSAVRLGLAIVLFLVIERATGSAGWLWALGLFTVAASTDWVDGWYARRFGQVSRLGRIFDPLVDKVIVCGSFVLLAERDGSAIGPWMAVIVVVRELVVTAVRAEMEREGIDFSAAWSGKVKMVLQCLAVGLELAARAEHIGGHDWLRPAAGLMAWLAVASTIWSGLEYLVAARRLVLPASQGGPR